MASAGGGNAVSTKVVRNPEFNGIQLGVGYHWFN
jgi:hypothetical protein